MLSELPARLDEGTRTGRAESAVSYYSTSLPTSFEFGRGPYLIASDGTRYLDFFCGAGALNYGHNPEHMVAALTDHLTSGRVVHAMDCDTPVKDTFLATLDEVVLKPRGWDHRVQFCGPTGTNAVEAALKLARKATGRDGVIAFAGSFHGMSAGSLAVGGNHAKRRYGATHSDVAFVPYPVGPHGEFDSLGYLGRLLDDPMSGVAKPAAIILEPVQMDGGIWSAPAPFLRALAELCQREGILLITDEIQSGNGRTDSFLATDEAGIVPDMVTLSKSLSGMGLPLSILLIRPELDVWSPGEHTGTFRANQLALVTATVALRQWADPEFVARVRDNAAYFPELLAREVGAKFPDLVLRGRGMTFGVDFGVDVDEAARVQRECFRLGLIVELCGRDDEVLKLFPPLTASRDLLEEGVRLLAEALASPRS